MKDATGELSMTAVAVVAIAAIGVVFTTLVWPQIRTNILRSTYCSQTLSCDEGTLENGTIQCTYCDDNDVNGECSAEHIKKVRCSAKDTAAAGGGGGATP